MRSILEQLYYGKIFPAEQYHPIQKDYKKIQQALYQHYEDFAKELESIEPALSERFKQIIDEQFHMTALDYSGTFVDGFRLGAQIMTEVLYDAHDEI